MEKISIARRRNENKKSLFSLKTESSGHSCAKTSVNTAALVPLLKSVISEEIHHQEKKW